MPVQAIFPLVWVWLVWAWAWLPAVLESERTLYFLPGASIALASTPDAAQAALRPQGGTPIYVAEKLALPALIKAHLVESITNLNRKDPGPERPPSGITIEVGITLFRFWLVIWILIIAYYNLQITG